ncbi:MAG: hypothetical protein AAB403_02465, partial [Planctomycetota bacterium]
MPRFIVAEHTGETTGFGDLAVLAAIIGLSRLHLLLDQSRCERPRILTVARGRRKLWRRGWGGSLTNLASPRQLLLDSPRQLVLTFRSHECVGARHLKVVVAGDLGGLNGAAADLLLPRHVGAAEGVGPETGEVAAFVLGGLMQRVADAGIPEALSRRPFLLEHEFVFVAAIRGGLLPETHHEIADAQRAPAVLALRAALILVSDALLDFDRGGVQVDVLPL